MSEDERELSCHFRFGENWRDYVDTVAAVHVEMAILGLEKLFPQGELAGKRMLDIGCGSGMSMLAALKLGAASCHGIDLDPHSVQAAQTLLGRFPDLPPWQVRQMSVFSLDATLGTFDVVHSWGVLHHTGNMWDAVERAAARVAPGGWLALAIYRKTPLCGFWRVEKKLYTKASPLMQKGIRFLFKLFYLLGLLATGRNPFAYIRNYAKTRGMSWSHDVHDWLGGYPYQSASPEEIKTRLGDMGFQSVRTFTKPAALWGAFGSHCDEFVFRQLGDRRA